jgi:hypothetical protein
MASARLFRRASRSRVWRWWGLALVAVMILGLGRLSVAPYAAMTLLLIVWTLFAAPVWCGAVNRERGRGVEYCRNNSSGLLLGCRIRQHKFQRFTSTWWSIGWRDRMRGTWAGGPAKIATVSAVVGILAFMFDIALFAGNL